MFVGSGEDGERERGKHVISAAGWARSRAGGSVSEGVQIVIERRGECERLLVVTEIRRDRKCFVKAIPQKLEEVSGDSRGGVLGTEEGEVRQQIVRGDGGVVQSYHEVGFRGMPLPKEFSGKLRDAALVSGYGPVREKCFFQGKKRRGAVEKEPSFGELSSRFT